MNKELVEKLFAKSGCIAFSPATKAYIDRAQAQLKEMNFAALPDDFLDFLSYCDGCYYDGLEMFGTKPHPRHKKQYTFRNLSEENRDFCDYTFFIGKLIIGRMSEHLLVYAGQNKIYAVLDRVNLCSMVESSDFDGLISTILQFCED